MSQIKDILRIYGLFLASMMTLGGAISIAFSVSLGINGELSLAVTAGLIGALMAPSGLMIIWVALKKPKVYQHPPYPAPPYYPPPPQPQYQIASPYHTYYPSSPPYWVPQQPYPPYQYQHPYYAPRYPPQPGYGIEQEEARLELPSIGILFVIFISAIILGGISLYLRGPALILFPIAFIIAFSFPSLMWISYVYKKDVMEPEPRRAVLIALTFGFLSTIPAMLLSFPFLYFGVFIAAVVGAPLVEEFCKASGLLIVKPNIKNELDGVIYGVTCGMGFAMVENFLYELTFLFSEVEPFALWSAGSLLRGLGSTIGHGVGAGIIGYSYAYYLMHRSRQGAFLNVVFAYLAAVGLHALWNGIAVTGGENPYGLMGIIFIAAVEILILKILVSRARQREMHRQIPAMSDTSFQTSGREAQLPAQGGFNGYYLRQPQPKTELRCSRCLQVINVPDGKRPLKFRCPICGAVEMIY